LPIPECITHCDLKGLDILRRIAELSPEWIRDDVILLLRYMIRDYIQNGDKATPTSAWDIWLNSTPDFTLRRISDGFVQLLEMELVSESLSEARHPLRQHYVLNEWMFQCLADKYGHPEHAEQLSDLLGRISDRRSITIMRKLDETP